jgi:hypothetical protein
MSARSKRPSSAIAARRVAAIVLLMAVTQQAAGGQAFVSNPPVGSSSLLPPNLVVPDMVRPLVTSMWRLSPTFRRQCARLAEHPEVLVRIDFSVRVPNGRAGAQVDRSHGGRHASVEIDVSKAAQYVEYIAHELEHVLEAVDGTDLPRLALQRVGGVVNLGGAYETARAQSVGRMVAREVMP